MGSARKRQVLDNATVSVQSTTTVITPATSLEGAPNGTADLAVFRRTNQDGSQTLNEQVEAGDSPAGPWSPQSSTALQNIVPGETRIRTVDITGLRYVRTTGTASGAGNLSVLASSSFIDRRTG